MLLYLVYLRFLNFERPDHCHTREAHNGRMAMRALRTACTVRYVVRKVKEIGILDENHVSFCHGKQGSGGYTQKSGFVVTR